MGFIRYTVFPTGLPCSEIHLCGESSAINIVERIVSSCSDEMEVVFHYKLTSFFGQSKLGNMSLTISRSVPRLMQILQLTLPASKVLILTGFFLISLY